MANTKRKFVAVCLCTAMVAGCSSLKVVSNPKENDGGVRFYRPKPYLLVTPADPTGRLVNLKLEYLPDFNEEYSAHIRGKTSIALKDGWNLVGVNTKDTPKEEEKPPAKIEDIKMPPAVVASSNVPIGYYESVYGYNGPKKFLQGWRYIGMTTLGGGQPNICRVPTHNPDCPPGGTAANGCINGPLYGLVFFNGAMTFRQLDEIANNQLCPIYVNPAPDLPSTPVAPPLERIPDIKATTPIDRAPSVAPGSSPPLPAPSTPPGGSAALSKPAYSPLPPLPAMTRPAVTPALVVTPAAKPAPRTTVALKGTVLTPAASTTKAPAVQAVVTGLPPLPQDLLMNPAPATDQDLFRTSTSLRP